ncbi:hypothetical protein [Neolewinella sp.]|uniref:hypothetical protein n=1 Tax=Neolewinella sp. TaxID=2993543 RepID=UPI003B51BA0A
MSKLRTISCFYLAGLLALGYACQTDTSETESLPPTTGVVAGVDTLTGLIAQGDYLLVKGNCLACHSSKLITQNRATREGWLRMIRWMQHKHGLQDLGDREGPILDYLAEHYAAGDETVRRQPLEVNWYELEQ